MTMGVFFLIGAAIIAVAMMQIIFKVLLASSSSDK